MMMENTSSARCRALAMCATDAFVFFCQLNYISLLWRYTQSLRFVSFRFVSFRFVSFRFVSFRFFSFLVSWFLGLQTSISGPLQART